jgi:hypothetical protein
MALVVGTNAYALVADGDTYFADRLNATAWTSASATDKLAALITAAALMDELPWVGMTAVDAVMAFPRIGSYFDSKLGRMVTLDGVTIPSQIVNANFEQALHLLSNPDVLSSDSSVYNLSLGGAVNLEKISKAPLIPAAVKRIVRPLLINQGSMGWWRAN